MNKSSLDSLAAALREQQAATAQAVTRLKAEWSPQALAALGKQKAADAVKAATLEPSGRPRAWVFILVGAVVSVAAIGIVVRVAGRKK